MPILHTFPFSLRLLVALCLLPLLVVAGCDDDGSDGDNETPTPSFTVSNSNPAVGEAVTFDASASNDPDGNIDTYSWTFGDGSSEDTEEATISYTYQSEGQYDVTLTVTDDEGASTTSDAQTVNVGTSGPSIVEVTDDITSDTEWTSDNQYVLDGLIFVDNATLTIEEGTVIKGRPQADITTGDGASALIINRGAQIQASGTSDNPIIFTSELDDLSDPEDLTDVSGNERRELWGGVIILGSATTNQGSETLIEGIPDPRSDSDPDNDNYGYYGGNDDSDNSGTFRYVSIRHGGFSISGQSGDEINGLTMGAVGSGTTIEYVEVFANFDDGFEWFGGTVETSHLVAAFMGDDGFDYDQGFRGSGQFWFGIHDEDAAGRGGEHDGGADAGDGATPYSTPVIANATYIGAGENATGVQGGDNGDRTFAIRDNAGGTYYNSVFTDFPGVGVNIEDLDSGPDSRERLEEGDLQFINTLFFGYGAGNTAEDIIPQAFVRNSDNFEASITDPSLQTISRDFGGGLDPRPTADAATSGAVDVVNGGFFEDVDYLGAFDPDAPLWTDGWTALSMNGYTSN